MKANKLSIGLVIDTSLDGNDGVQQYVKRLGAWFTSEGHEVSYLTSDSVTERWAGGDVHSLAHKITVKFNANRVSMPLWPRLAQVKQTLKINSFDVLHIMAPYSPLLAQRIINQAEPATAVVGTFHIMPTNFMQTFGTKLLRIVYGRSLGRFDSFIAVSPASAEFARKTLGISPVVIPNPVDIKAFSGHEPSKKNKKMKIVFLGRLVERKGAQWLLQAVEILKQKQANFEVVIAGNGPMRSDLEGFVKRHELGEIVSFTGFIEEDDKPALLASADIACFPAVYGEAFGIVLIEAMAAGSGVVLAGDNPGYRSVLGAQPDMLIESRDARAFAERLSKLLTDKKLASKLHSWQQTQISQYDTPEVGRSTLGVYYEAIAKRNGS